MLNVSLQEVGGTIPASAVITNCQSLISLKKSSVYDCTVEDAEYIYNKLSIHIFNSKIDVI